MLGSTEIWVAPATRGFRFEEEMSSFTRSAEANLTTADVPTGQVSHQLNLPESARDSGRTHIDIVHVHLERLGQVLGRNVSWLTAVLDKGPRSRCASVHR